MVGFVIHCTVCAVVSWRQTNKNKTLNSLCLWPLINLRIISYCDSWHIFCMLLKDQESFGWFLWKVCGASKNWLGSLKFGSILPKRKTFEIVLPWSDCWIWIKSLGICFQKGFIVWLKLTCYRVSGIALFFINSAMTDCRQKCR